MPCVRGILPLVSGSSVVGHGGEMAGRHVLPIAGDFVLKRDRHCS